MTRITSAFKGLIDPADRRFVEGSEESRREAREEWRKQKLTGQVMRAELEEVPRSNLAFQRRGIIEDTTSGQLYRAVRGLVNVEHVADPAAFYIAADGWPVVLVRPRGPQTFAEREQRRAEREAQHNAPKPRRRRRVAT